jgi:hypothetical protein
MNVCECEHSVPAHTLKIHTRHFNFKGMELQTARDSSHLCYCDACMQLKLCVFHDEPVRLIELVILVFPLLPHIGVVLWLAPDRPTFRQYNLVQSPLRIKYRHAHSVGTKPPTSNPNPNSFLKGFPQTVVQDIRYQK